jgi:hypothetical protein
MGTTRSKMISNAFYEAGKDQRESIIVHKKFKSNSFVARLDGVSDNYVAESQSINDVIAQARGYMLDHDIYSMIIHEANGKIRWIKEKDESSQVALNVRRALARWKTSNGKKRSKTPERSKARLRMYGELGIPAFSSKVYAAVGKVTIGKKIAHLINKKMYEIEALPGRIVVMNTIVN